MTPELIITHKLMKLLSLPILVLLAVTTSASAQSKKKMDAEAIKKMCGCFEVTFNFSIINFIEMELFFFR